MHIPKKPIWKKATHTIWLQLYDILEKGSYGDSEKKKKESVAARGWRERGWIGGTQRVFSAVKLFCIIPQWWIHVIKHLWKLKECTTPRVNSNILSVDSSVVTNVPLWCDIFMAGGQCYVCTPAWPGRPETSLGTRRRGYVIPPGPGEGRKLGLPGSFPRPIPREGQGSGSPSGLWHHMWAESIRGKNSFSCSPPSPLKAGTEMRPWVGKGIPSNTSGWGGLMVRAVRQEIQGVLIPFIRFIQQTWAPTVVPVMSWVMGNKPQTKQKSLIPAAPDSVPRPTPSQSKVAETRPSSLKEPQIMDPPTQPSLV